MKNTKNQQAGQVNLQDVLAAISGLTQAVQQIVNRVDALEQRNSTPAAPKAKKDSQGKQGKGNTPKPELTAESFPAYARQRMGWALENLSEQGIHQVTWKLGAQIYGLMKKAESLGIPCEILGSRIFDFKSTGEQLAQVTLFKAGNLLIGFKQNTDNGKFFPVCEEVSATPAKSRRGRKPKAESAATPAAPAAEKPVWQADFDKALDVLLRIKQQATDAKVSQDVLAGIDSIAGHLRVALSKSGDIKQAISQVVDTILAKAKTDGVYSMLKGQALCIGGIAKAFGVKVSGALAKIVA